ncbi:MAG: response regulator transcription factor [candidate division WOR-3 bacterium]|nr:response regulator transcription factor [candidate division WOR-3 bacterium]
MSKLIAVVDDEQDIVDLITHHLEKEKFKVEPFYDGESILEYTKKHRPDLIILDLMLPGIDGLEVCKLLKKDEQTAGIPIIMLTAKSTEADKVVGLELGADDYITKPFSPRELIARVKSVLRRAESKQQQAKIIEFDNLTVDLNKYRVTINKKQVKLTTTEFKLLAVLVSRPGWVFNRQQLLDEIWDYDRVVLDRTIDVHIRNLRRKLGKYGDYIKSVRGFGYKFEKD